MSLFQATFLLGLLLVVLGGLYAANPSWLAGWSQRWPRSKQAALVLFGPAALWFLWHVANLSQADFGDYSKLLLLGFGAVALGSFFVVRDFLAVRGLAVLILLAARPLLDAAYMQYDHPQRLLMVSTVYVLIVLALWAGATPFIMRDFYGWLFSREGRSRRMGIAVALLGLALLGTAVSY